MMRAATSICTSAARQLPDVKAVAASTSGRCAFKPFVAARKTAVLNGVSATATAQRQQRQASRQQQWRCRAMQRPVVALFGWGNDDDDEPDVSVIKLQMGVFGRVDDFQRQLDRVASLLDLDDEESLAEMVRETVLFINRHVEYVAYGASARYVTQDLGEAEQKFNEASLKERTKFKRETLSNFGGRLQRDRLQEKSSDTGLDRWLAITLLVVVEGEPQLPKVRTLADLRKALTSLAALPPEDVIAAELLWTPQEEGDYYAKDELLADYPGLNNL